MKLILPDGKELLVEEGLSGKEVAKQIAISLEKKALSYNPFVTVEYLQFGLSDTFNTFSIIASINSKKFSCKSSSVI